VAWQKYKLIIIYKQIPKIIQDSSHKSNEKRKVAYGGCTKLDKNWVITQSLGCDLLQ
jgi:hypothetical protein